MAKINGFSKKPHPYQITSYIYLSALILSYFFLLMPISSNISKIIGAILEAVISIVILISGYLVTDIDPSDPIMKKTKEAELSKTSCNTPVQELYCPTDKSYVMNSSKHCKRCNRCTEGFDHHCKWVNNDVGKANYRHFLVLIVSVTAFLIVYMACAISLTLDYAKDAYLLKNEIYIYSHDPQQILTIMIILWILMVISGVFLFMALNLVLLHLYLISKGLTTYQYIIDGDARRAKNKEENAKNEADKNKRVCVDFILCLKKRRVVAQSALSLNAETQKSVDKELNKNSQNKDRKLSDFLRRDESKAALDNTQNEENICADIVGASITHTVNSHGNNKEANKIFAFDKNSTDGSERVLIPKSNGPMENNGNGISPGRRDQESAHKVQVAKMPETRTENLEIQSFQNQSKSEIPLYPMTKMNQMRAASCKIEKKSISVVRGSNHTFFAEDGKSTTQTGFHLPRLSEANRGEQSIRDKKKYEIPNNSLDNKFL